MNTISAVNRYLRLDSSDRLIGLSSVSFDLSVYDIFGALSAGAALVVPTESERIDPSRWLSLCKENNVTVWNTVPALMDLLLDYCKATGQKPAGLSLRSVILSGDWIPMELYGKLKETIPGASLISMGGATEASIWSIIIRLIKLRKAGLLFRMDIRFPINCSMCWTHSIGFVRVE